MKMPNTAASRENTAVSAAPRTRAAVRYCPTVKSPQVRKGRTNSMSEK